MPAWLGWAALHVLIAAAGTWLLRGYALRRRIVDLPGERRSHSVATPRGGGMAIVAAVLVGAALGALLAPALRFEILGLAAGCVLVAGVGWWDDHRPLPASLRLLVHLLAAAWLGVVAWIVGAAPWLALLAALACVALVNVWNFMDGINGLAASQAAIAALAFAAVTPMPSGWAGLGLAAACLGFLPFNFPRARIFMGDGGSGALGYLLAALMLLAVLHGGVAPAWAWVPLTAFVVDAGFTLGLRMLSRQRWWEAHSQHVYQRLARRLDSHTLVTLGYGCFSVAAVTLFFQANAGQPGWGAVGSMGWLMLASAIWLLLRKGLRNH